MAWLDYDDKGYPKGEILKCERCGKVEINDVTQDAINKKYDTLNYYDGVVFRRRHKLNIDDDFCAECLEIIAPLVWAMRDIIELRTYVNKLERAINEKRRDQNNGTTQDRSRKRCKCSSFG